MTNDEMVWELSQLVESTDPNFIQKKLELMLVDAETMRDSYRNRIGNLDAKDLVTLFEMRDAYTLKFEGVTLYCRLMYSADSTNDIAKQLYDASRMASMKVHKTLAFIEIELGHLLTKQPEFVNDPTLAEDKHLLERILRRVPHMLSETMERVIIRKDKNGINGWQMLQSDWLST